MMNSWAKIIIASIVSIPKTRKPCKGLFHTDVFGIAATLSSRVLAQLSTVRDADGLICRVRDGTGSFPAAMAAMPTLINLNFLY